MKTNLKRRIAAMGLTLAAVLCMTGCNTSNQEESEGSLQRDELSIEYGQPNVGGAEVSSDEAEVQSSSTYEVDDGDMNYSPMDVPIEY